VPDRIWRRCGAAALLATVAVLALLLAIHLAGDSTDVLKQRLHWAATSLAVIEGPLAVGACVWLLGAAQRYLNRPPRRLGRALARSAFGAFIMQGPVLIGLMLALRQLGLSAEIKALIVACAGITISFALAWLLVSRTWSGRTSCVRRSAYRNRTWLPRPARPPSQPSEALDPASCRLTARKFVYLMCRS
jgi:hypothetical protein